MKVIYKAASDFNVKMKSGLMREKFGEINVIAYKENYIPIILESLKRNFKTNLTQDGIPYTELQLLIWFADEEDPSTLNSFQMTFNERISSAGNTMLVHKALEQIKRHEDLIEEVRITRDCELDAIRVEQLLNDIKEGDIFENILEHISKLCLIDSETYRSKEEITRRVDEFETLLFEELVDKKIRINGKSGVLKRVQGDCKYGFFERGIRKDYVCLSLVQKMGARTIREIGF